MSAEKLILLNVEMVRATLDRRKTQTRRPVKDPRGMSDAPKRFDAYSFYSTPHQCGVKDAFGFENEDGRWKSPFGKPGDVLCVRESARVLHYSKSSRWMDIEYVADGTKTTVPWPDRMKWNPVVGHCIPNGCHLEAIRIKRKNKRVWVERVQDISELDAIAEGLKKGLFGSYEAPGFALGRAPIQAFQALWDSIYGNWDDNDWLWCSEFEEGN